MFDLGFILVEPKFFPNKLLKSEIENSIFEIKKKNG